jgi:hypothetical protein
MRISSPVEQRIYLHILIASLLKEILLCSTTKHVTEAQIYLKSTIFWDVMSRKPLEIQ